LASSSAASRSLRVWSKGLSSSSSQGKRGLAAWTINMAKSRGEETQRGHISIYTENPRNVDAAVEET
jgi:hypothetical protein